MLFRSEQGDGIQMVNATLSQLDHITQQNAALVEHAAAAAESMRAQASKLTDAVAAFTIDIDQHHETCEQPPRAKRLPPVKRTSKLKTPSINGLSLAKQLASN